MSRALVTLSALMLLGVSRCRSPEPELEVGVEVVSGVRCGRLTVGEYRINDVVPTSPGCAGEVTFRGRPSGSVLYRLPTPTAISGIQKRPMAGAEAVVERQVVLREPEQIDQRWKIQVDHQTEGSGLEGYSFVDDYFMVIEVTGKLASGGNKPYTIEKRHDSDVTRQRWLADPLFCTRSITVKLHTPVGDIAEQPWTDATVIPPAAVYCSETHDGVLALKLTDAMRGQAVDVEVGATGYPLRYFRIEPEKSDLFTIVEVILPHPG